MFAYRGKNDIPVAQYQAPIEQMTGTNANGLQEYGYYARLLTVFPLIMSNIP